MFGGKQLHLPQLNEFLYLIKRGVSDREAAKRAFGDLEILLQRLAECISQRREFEK
jgi:hypothetical protein